MNEYAIFGIADAENEAPLKYIVTQEAFGFAHALELALQQKLIKPGLVVVKVERLDACKVYKVYKAGGVMRFERP